MPDPTFDKALDERMTAAVREIGSADLLVGIPSYRNAATIGHVARSAAEGLRSAFPGARAVVVSSDGGSDDGTRDRVREALDGTPSVIGEYVGLPGKGSAFRAIFSVAAQLGARACAVVDSDLRSINPQWIERLLEPVASGRADYVAPLYARHKHDGTITNTIAYPLTRALYGARVRQPIGGEFGFSGDLARAFLEGGALGGDVWRGDVARFGIDVFMTTTALVRGARVVQTPLGAKVHDPKDPGADLGPMFRQVVGTAFRLASANRARWSTSGSREVPSSAEPMDVEPEPVSANVELLVGRFREAANDHRATWKDALSAGSVRAVETALGQTVPRALGAEAWATLVYDALASSARDPERTDAFVLSLVPLYLARVAVLFDDARDMTTAQAERLVEDQARAYEARLPYLRANMSA